MVLTNVGTTDYGIGSECERVTSDEVMRGEFQIEELKHERVIAYAIYVYFLV